MKKGLLLLTLASALFSGVSMSAHAADQQVASVQTAEKGSDVSVSALDGKVSLNGGTAEQFASVLNGVGQKKAEAIVNYREQYGNFTQLEQLSEVPGFGRALVERNLDRLKL
ncbi:AraC family transcriptional regulator [Enterobacterales bacterium CwR94]|nr:AraC family transcriptional regulator [Enterobacterales bacterium CwR94]